MKRVLILNIALLLAFALCSKEVQIKQFRLYGPVPVNKPFLLDSVGVDSKSFSEDMFLNSYVPLELVKNGTLCRWNDLPVSKSDFSLNLISFNIQNRDFVKGDIAISGIKNYSLYVDGVKKEAGTLRLEPATHDVVIKYISVRQKKDSVKVVFKSDKDNFAADNIDKHFYTIRDVMNGKRISGISVSPSGKYIIMNYMNVLDGGTSENISYIKEICTGKVLYNSKSNIKWMPKTDCVYYLVKSGAGRNMISYSPSTGEEKVIASNIPDGYFDISPNEEYLLYVISNEGPKEKKEIYEVLEPDDRQPGWRRRSSLYKYDIKTGVMQPLTFGNKNIWAVDMSKDGRYILMKTSRSRLTKRPTTVFSLYRFDTETFAVDSLVNDDGFISYACFSPDGKEIAITGSAEALGGIGRNLPAGRIPSMTDEQIFIMNIATGQVRPVTKDFNPNVQYVAWNRNDGNIYFTAENKDCISLYKMVPSSGKISMIETGEDIVKSFSFDSNANVGAYCGQSASNTDRAYIYDLRKNKSRIFEDLNKEVLSNITLGECKEWNFVNSKGDTIYGRYYLPPYFDEKKSYPMIVNYYGGCSPISRYFESRYPHHAYAALGYVVYVIEPSGATGFGQEFASRHVNTAGEGVAEDIIEGTKKFVAEHSFVNGKKIGCIGASYGGFMTQYLQTKTNIFACAISHAGISDHTSYWGEGYWGYSYSEVSMANRYPWMDRKLYVEQSPLFNADKINTPILFLHGSADNNVPVGESIQMFTALKLLGKETALVIVDGQDHHITDYNKRIMWQNSIFAWFAKWLKGEPSWWNEMYPPKNL